MTTIRAQDIKRRGRTILLGQGRTATEGSDGLPTLTIRDGGKVVKTMRGSSLVFARALRAGDRDYLASLGSDNA